MSTEILRQALLATIADLQQNPGHAKMEFEAETVLEGDVRCSGRVRDFPPLTIDEPPALGGQNAGMNPVELVLVALGTCQEIMYAAYAAVLGIRLDQVRVDVQGQLDARGLFGLDPSLPSGFQKVTFTTHLWSPAEEASLRKLVETVQTHCPVLDTLTRAVEVAGEVSYNGGVLQKAA
jgi:uncharacterized OsmC-like protein